MDKGIVTNEEVKEFAKWIDPFINLEDVKVMGFSLEGIDDTAIAGLMNFTDNKWGDKLPEYFKPALRSVIVDLPKGDFSKLAQNIAAITEGLNFLKGKVKDFVQILVRKNLEAVIEFIELNKELMEGETVPANS